MVPCDEQTLRDRMDTEITPDLIDLMGRRFFYRESIPKIRAIIKPPARKAA